jgi:hypothetical protein
MPAARRSRVAPAAADQTASGSATAKSAAIVFGFWPIPWYRSPCPVVAGTTALSGSCQSSSSPPSATRTAAPKIAATRGSARPFHAAIATPAPAANNAAKVAARPRLSS